MLITELFFNKTKKHIAEASNDRISEDAWSGGMDSTYHTGNGMWNDGSDMFGQTTASESDDQWSGGADSTYHTGKGMWEDLATTNYITNEDDHVDFGHIITARELIGRATQDPQNEKHRYFEYLKDLRNKFGKNYSTQVHQHAAKLATAKDL